jgi:hypothetical protein
LKHPQLFEDGTGEYQYLFVSDGHKLQQLPLPLVG